MVAEVFQFSYNLFVSNGLSFKRILEGRFLPFTMPIDLQNSVVYGPIHSRRLGNSLGINILPLNWKLCDFDCVYCQYGWTPEKPGEEKVKRVDELLPIMEEELAAFKEAGEPIDCITIAGNGEPALHPDLLAIVQGLKRLRDRFYPEARLGILTDASMIHKPLVKQALLELDDRYLKLDVASPEDFEAINRPLGKFDWNRFIEELRSIPDKVLQSLFVTGSYDNTSEAQVEKWVKLVSYVRPNAVQVYTVDRPTADPGIRKVSSQRLHEIAEILEQTTGIEAYVFE